MINSAHPHTHLQLYTPSTVYELGLKHFCGFFIFFLSPTTINSSDGKKGMLPWWHRAVAAGNYSGLSASRGTRAGTQWRMVTPGHTRASQTRQGGGISSGWASVTSKGGRLDSRADSQKIWKPRSKPPQVWKTRDECVFPCNIMWCMMHRSSRLHGQGDQ